MKKIRFNALPIYKAIRGSKLSKRAQDEVLSKLAKYRKKTGLNEEARNLFYALNWSMTLEGYNYWFNMNRDSGL